MHFRFCYNEPVTDSGEYCQFLYSDSISVGRIVQLNSELFIVGNVQSDAMQQRACWGEVSQTNGISSEMPRQVLGIVWLVYCSLSLSS